MNIHFSIPPEKQRIGGLDKAIFDLAEQLKLQDHEVSTDENKLPSEEVQLVHFHGLWQPQHRAVYKHCIKNDIPYVISAHGMLEPYAWRHKWLKKKVYFEMIERKHFTNAKAVLTTSNLESSSVQKIVQHANIQSIPLGYNQPQVNSHALAKGNLGWDEEKTHLLYLSRIDPKKGLSLLLQALLDNNFGKNHQLSLHIVGEGDSSYMRELTRFIDTNKNRLPPIDWVGPVWDERKWDYLSGADLFCLPTKSENFGIAVLEAALCGTPVLTSPYTPWGEYAALDYFYITDSTPSAIQDAISTYINTSTKERGEMKTWAETNFLWSNLIHQYIQFYRDLI